MDKSKIDTGGLRVLLKEQREKLKKHVPEVIHVDNIHKMIEDVIETVKDHYDEGLK